MYLDFFNFKQNPFLASDPEFLFLSPSNMDASAAILYGIEARKGLVAVMGEAGVGKTTVMKSYLEGADPEKTKIVYICYPAISFDMLLNQIVSELDIKVFEKDKGVLLSSFLRYLIEEYKKSHKVILIIDEAQNTPVETLERLRTLSNLETSKHKLLQIVLVGQPEFEDKLNLSEMRKLRQRIAICCRIEALKRDECFAYIQHRLMKASRFHSPVFTKSALKQIVRKANGIPRVINILCDNALAMTFGYKRKRVTGKIIKEVIKDLQGRETGSPAKSFSINWRIVWVRGLMPLGLAAFVAWGFLTSAEISEFIRKVEGITEHFCSLLTGIIHQLLHNGPTAS